MWKSIPSIGRTESEGEVVFLYIFPPVVEVGEDKIWNAIRLR